MGVVFARHRLGDKTNWAVITGAATLLISSAFLYIQGSVFNEAFLIILMMASMPLLLALGNRLFATIPRKFYLDVVYASFCMYLLHRVVFDLTLRIHSPGTNTLTVVYLTLTAIPVTYFASFYLQRGYDWAIGRITRNR